MTAGSTAYGYDFLVYAFVFGSLWSHEFIFEEQNTENIMHGCAGLILSQCIRMAISTAAAPVVTQAYLWTFFALLALDAWARTWKSKMFPE